MLFESTRSLIADLDSRFQTLEVSQSMALPTRLDTRRLHGSFIADWWMKRGRSAEKCRPKLV